MSRSFDESAQFDLGSLEYSKTLAFFPKVLNYTQTGFDLTTKVTRCDCEIIVQKLAETVFVKIYANFFTWKKWPKNFGYFFIFFKKLTQENSYPIGESSPNLVTLQS
jgi:hypothetical protein